jgi:hypothetical protein
MTAWTKWRPRRPAGPQHEEPAQERQETAAAEPPLKDQPAEDVGQDDEEADEEPAAGAGERRPWWTRPAPDEPDQPEPQTWTVSPGVQVTINQPPQAPVRPPTSAWRLRTRRWLLRHGAAAGVGWMFGLYQSMAALVDSPERGGSAAGLGLAGIGWLFAEIITDRLGRYLPARLRAAVHWTARIPFATALLVTALHAPNAAL